MGIYDNLTDDIDVTSISYDKAVSDDDKLYYKRERPAGEGDNMFYTFRHRKDRQSGIKQDVHWFVYFITDPWTADVDGGWFSYTEVLASAGLEGGVELPDGLKSFPVKAGEWRIAPNGNEYLDEYPPEKITDPLYKAVVPYIPAWRTKFKNAREERPLFNKTAFNAWLVQREALPGGQFGAITDERHAIIEMDWNHGRDIIRWIDGYRAMHADFTMVGRCAQLSLTSAPDGKTVFSKKPINDAPPVELPTPINVKERIIARRAQVLEFAKSWNGGMPDQAYPTEQATGEDMPSWATRPDTEKMDMPAVNDVLDRQALYASWGETMLKTKLNQAGITFPERASVDALRALAAEHAI